MVMNMRYRGVTSLVNRPIGRKGGNKGNRSEFPGNTVSTVLLCGGVRDELLFKYLRRKFLSLLVNMGI